MTAYTITLSWPSLASRGRQIKSRRLLGSSHEVFSPYSAEQFESTNPGLPHPIRSTYRFSQPLSVLLLKSPCGLISYHWHSWDSLYRVFPSNAASYLHQTRYLLKMRRIYYCRHKCQLRQISNFYTPKGIQKKDDTVTTGFNARVRSRPITVLPDTGGRYSLELLTRSTSQCLS